MKSGTFLRKLGEMKRHLKEMTKVVFDGYSESWL